MPDVTLIGASAVVAVVGCMFERVSRALHVHDLGTVVDAVDESVRFA
jgi:hypothetical protein